MDDVHRETLTETQRFWLQHLEGCESSGVSLARYAAEHGLRAGSLYVWKSKLRRLGLLGSHAVEAAFDRVAIEPRLEDAQISCSVRLPNGCVLDLGGLRGHTAFVSVIAAVAALP